MDKICRHASLSNRLIMKQLLEYLKQIYSDASGQASLMRYLSSAIVISALIYPYTVNNLTVVDAGLITSMLTIGLGGKAVQKHLERRK